MYTTFWLKTIMPLVAAACMLLLFAVPATAGVGGSVVVNFPNTVSVGQTFQARITYTNNSDGDNLGENVLVSGIQLNPSCGNLTCSITDPGVFSAAVGQGGFFCAGTMFTPVTAADGTITFEPNADVVLGPADGSAGTNSRRCQVIFNMTVLKMPTVDAGLGGGIQTRQLATAQFTGQDSALGAQGFGSAITSVTTPTLSISKTPDSGTISAGDTATFTIVVTNQGPGTAMAVAIDDTLPAGGGLTWQTATPNCQVNANVLHCAVGNLANNGSFTAVVTAVTTEQACGVLNNTATGSASNAASVQDNGQITCTAPALSISKTPDGGSVVLGGIAEFTIVISNSNAAGTGTAKNAGMTDQLPTGFTWTVSQQPAPGTCSINGSNLMTCTGMADLAPGATRTIKVRTTTSAAACGPMVNGTAQSGGAIATASNHASVRDWGDITCTPPAGTGIIAPTQTTCQDYINGKAEDLGQINYSVGGGKISGNINPGVFFFYTRITTAVVNQVVDVTQTHTGSGPLFSLHQDQGKLYTGDCKSSTGGTPINNGTGEQFVVATPGTYVIGIKYSSKSVAGEPAPVPDDLTYTFSTSLGGTTSGSVLLKK